MFSAGKRPPLVDFRINSDIAPAIGLPRPTRLLQLWRCTLGAASRAQGIDSANPWPESCLARAYLFLASLHPAKPKCTELRKGRIRPKPLGAKAGRRILNDLSETGLPEKRLWATLQ